MPVDPSVEFSPAWWAAKLSMKLDARIAGDRNFWRPAKSTRRRSAERSRPGLSTLFDYTAGDPPMPRVSDAWRDAMRSFLRVARMNYADLCVTSVSERMTLLGFATAVDNDESGDQAASEIATVNEMQSWLPTAWDDMLTGGSGFLAVGDVDPSLRTPTFPDGVPLVTLESPFQCFVQHDLTGRRPRAGIKRYVDEWSGRTVTWVFDAAERRRWQIVGTEFGEGGEDGFPTPVFPLVEIQNRNGVGDFESHLDVLNRINDGIFDRMVIQKMQAFRQRAAIGLPDRNPETGEPIDYAGVFELDPGAMWRMPEDTTMWESTPVDLGPIRAAIKDDVLAFAAVTKSPVHFIVPDAANGSAEGARSMRESYSYRVKDRRVRAHVGLARMMGACFRALGDDARADALSIRPLWEPIDQPSLGESADAFVKVRSEGWPFGDASVRFMGVAPEEVGKLNDDRSNDLFFEQAQAELAAPAPVPAPSSAAVA